MGTEVFLLWPLQLLAKDAQDQRRRFSLGPSSSASYACDVRSTVWAAWACVSPDAILVSEQVGASDASDDTVVTEEQQVSKWAVDALTILGARGVVSASETQHLVSLVTTAFAPRAESPAVAMVASPAPPADHNSATHENDFMTPTVAVQLVAAVAQTPRLASLLPASSPTPSSESRCSVICPGPTTCQESVQTLVPSDSAARPPVSDVTSTTDGGTTPDMAAVATACPCTPFPCASQTWTACMQYLTRLRNGGRQQYDMGAVEHAWLCHLVQHHYKCADADTNAVRACIRDGAASVTVTISEKGAVTYAATTGDKPQCRLKLAALRQSVAA